MSIKVEDYYAPETFQRMKAFADTKETPFVLIDTAIISKAYDDLRAGFEFAKVYYAVKANPAVEIIKSIPSVWDETIALPQSEIGELAAFARRSGSTWFLAIMNGATARTLEIRLAFLGRGKYQATLARDWNDEAAAITIGNASVGRNDSLTIELRAGGGFIGRFAK